MKSQCVISLPLTTLQLRSHPFRLLRSLQNALLRLLRQREQQQRRAVLDRELLGLDEPLLSVDPRLLLHHQMALQDHFLAQAAAVGFQLQRVVERGRKGDRVVGCSRARVAALGLGSSAQQQLGQLLVPGCCGPPHGVQHEMGCTTRKHLARVASKRSD